MNLLEMLRLASKRQKNRIPFSGREKKTASCQMRIEEFSDKAKRNERYVQLRTNRTPGLCKFSTVRENKNIWCIARS